MGLDSVDDAPPPVGHQQAASPVDEQRKRVLETGREGSDAPGTTVSSEFDADDAPAEAAAVVLPPLGDEEIAPISPGEALARVEREPVGRGVRLEVGGRRGDAVTTAGQTKRPGISPAAGPAVARAARDEDERVRGLGIAGRAELVLPVDACVEATGSWLNGQPIWIAEA